MGMLMHHHKEKDKPAPEKKEVVKETPVKEVEIKKRKKEV